MKKILEISQYGDHELRFNTDLDLEKRPEDVGNLIGLATWAMTTTLWGGNELTVLGVIRALSIADLAVSVNREEMIQDLDRASSDVAHLFKQSMEELKRSGTKMTWFPPGVKPSKAQS